MIGRLIIKYKKYKSKRLIARFSKIGNFNDISYDIDVVNPEGLNLGSYIYIGPGAEINGLGGIDIKDGVIIGPNLVIHSANHHFANAKMIPYDDTFDLKKVTINENVWIGGNVIIVPGTSIGEGAIIGAGAVVSGEIPPLSIVVGNPCKVIKNRDSEHYFNCKNRGDVYMKHKLSNK